MKRLNDPLSYAIEKASEIPYEQGKYRLYAVIVDKKNRIVSEHENSYIKTHPLQAFYAKKVGREEAIFLHAEMGSLVKADPKKAYAIYVARVNYKNEPVLAKPCEICMEAIKLSNIEIIEYTK